MDLLVPAIVILGVICIGIYTMNFGRWVWGQNNKGGAIGVWFIALVSTVLPIFLFFFH